MREKPSASRLGEIQPREVVKDEYAVHGDECDIDRLCEAALRLQ
jgi:hypothetical protein